MLGTRVSLEMQVHCIQEYGGLLILTQLFQKDPTETDYDEFLYNIGFGQGFINQMQPKDIVSLNSDSEQQNSQHIFTESINLNKLMIPKQRNFMVYSGKSLFGDKEPCVYLISYKIVYINEQQANEMTPIDGPISHTQPLNSKIFQNMIIEVDKGPSEVEMQNGQVIPQMPVNSESSDDVPNEYPQDEQLPRSPRLLTTCHPDEFVFPVDPADLNSAQWIYKPKGEKLVPIGMRPENVWEAYVKPLQDNFIIDQVPYPTVTPPKTKWIPYYYVPLPAFPGSAIHFQPRYILVPSDYE